jgi:hypothetical protein
MKLIDKLFRRSNRVETRVMTPVAPTPLDPISQRITLVRDELIAAINTARTKAETARNELGQARLDIAKMKLEVAGLKHDLQFLRTAVDQQSGPTTDQLASLSRLLEPSEVTSSRNGNPTVGAGHTFTVVQADIDVGCAVAAFSGLSSSPLESDLNGQGFETLQFGDITPVNTGDLIVTGINDFTATAAPSIDTGFTVTDALSGESNFSSPALAYLIASNTDPVNPTWTNNGGRFGTQLIGAIAAFAQA